MIDSPLGRMMPVAFQQVQLYGSLCDDMEFKKDSPEPIAEFKKSTDAAEKNKKEVCCCRGKRNNHHRPTRKKSFGSLKRHFLFWKDWHA
jgi:hypothetical protein